LPGEREQAAEVIQNSPFSYNNLQQTLALGLMALAKHDRAESQFGQNYTDDQLASQDRFTLAETQKLREQAAIMLIQFASYLSIPEERLWTGWGRPIIQGLVAAFVYSLLLIVIAILAKLGGHDLIDILRDALKPG
jgi:DNA-binding transcriptional regulator YiaG